MQVTVKLYGENREKMVFELPEGSTLEGLALLLKIPYNDSWLYGVNGRVQSLARILQDGDEVFISPPVAGG